MLPASAGFHPSAPFVLRIIRGRFLELEEDNKIKQRQFFRVLLP
jgi:hypothetical protein